MAVQNETKQYSKTKIKEPKRYKVIMHDDDYTPMDFVVEVLIEVFRKEKEDAVNIMFQVHKGGRAAVGIYPYDIARTKIRTVMSLAKDQGYPFRLTLEEA